MCPFTELSLRPTVVIVALLPVKPFVANQVLFFVGWLRATNDHEQQH